MKDKESYSFELEKEKYDFLQQMVDKYDLPDVGKAVRCLINYARESDPDILEEIFEDIRCLDC